MGAPVDFTMEQHKLIVLLRQTGEVFLCGRGETVLSAMVRAGRKGIPVGCENGGCGVCKVQIHRGAHRIAGAMSEAHVSLREKQCGVALACRVIPETDIDVEVIGGMQKGFLHKFYGRPTSGLQRQ